MALQRMKLREHRLWCDVGVERRLCCDVCDVGVEHRLWCDVCDVGVKHRL